MEFIRTEEGHRIRISNIESFRILERTKEKIEEDGMKWGVVAIGNGCEHHREFFALFTSETEEESVAFLDGLFIEIEE